MGWITSPAGKFDVAGKGFDYGVFDGIWSAIAHDSIMVGADLDIATELAWNGGFESSDVYWSGFNPAALSTAEIVTSEKHSGSKSLHLITTAYGNYTGWCQYDWSPGGSGVMPTIVGQTYTISGYLRWKSGDFVGIIAYDAVGGPRFQSVPKVDDWQFVSLTFVATNNQTYVGFVKSTTATITEFYVDDFSMKQTTEIVKDIEKVAADTVSIADAKVVSYLMALADSIAISDIKSGLITKLFSDYVAVSISSASGDLSHSSLGWVGHKYFNLMNSVGYVEQALSENTWAKSTPTTGTWVKKTNTAAIWAKTTLTSGGWTRIR